MRCRNCWHILSNEDLEDGCCGDCSEPLDVVWCED